MTSAPNIAVMPYVLNVNKHSVRIAGIKFITKAHASDIDKEVYNPLSFPRHTLGERPVSLINRALAAHLNKTLLASLNKSRCSMKLSHMMIKIIRKTDKWESFLAPLKFNL